MSRDHPTERRAGFTVLELLVVIVIIIILAGMLFVAGNALRRHTRSKTTKVLISRIEAAIDQYNEMHGTGWMSVLPERDVVGLASAGADPSQAQIDAVKAANHIVTDSVLMSQNVYEFREGGQFSGVVSVGGEAYMVDPWFHAEDPDRDLDNNMIWIARDGFDPVVDIWSTGPDGRTDVLALTAGAEDARHEYGDDIVNW